MQQLSAGGSKFDRLQRSEVEKLAPAELDPLTRTEIKKPPRFETDPLTRTEIKKSPRFELDPLTRTEIETNPRTLEPDNLRMEEFYTNLDFESTHYENI